VEIVTKPMLFVCGGLQSSSEVCMVRADLQREPYSLSTCHQRVARGRSSLELSWLRFGLPWDLERRDWKIRRAVE
jgi:hypothetical protein